MPQSRSILEIQGVTLKHSLKRSNLFRRTNTRK
ncbi:hypothetical protein GcC1_015047 [Golovinomyces cichoracearum]|uniref:Uncharacterized protein n=1 Tax=Golovinomyces cichoracearum TaxID=62708 RepID=A0A420J6I3_9PEZI|nr:hypothetical protein GcC1_015047 [Golovinomyces cichoracearum]